MTAATRSSVLPAASVSAALVNELRTILDRHEQGRAQSLVADFVLRHQLTHNDVDALLVMLTRQRAPNRPVVPPKRSASQTHALLETDNSASSSVAEGRVAESNPLEASTAGGMDTGGTRDEETTDDGLDWMFGEAPEQPVSLASDEAVEKSFEDLLGDWTRTGGRLTRAEVALLVTRRGLSAMQHGELLSLLEEAGVDLPPSVDTRPSRSAVKGYELHGDTVRQYLREISRYPLISAGREVELWSLMREGDAARRALDAGWGELSRKDRRSLRDRVEEGRKAHAALVCANLRLVVSIAKAGRYNQTGVEFADRIQDGNMGLMHAAHLFDGSKGYKFSTYATWWIRQHIERGIADRGRTIRIPVHVHEQVQKIRKTARKLTDRFDREPTLEELADATSMEAGKVQAMLELGQPVRSIDILLGEEGDLRLSDVLVHDEERDGRTDPASIVEHAMLHDDIDHVLREVLPDRAADVIRRRFGLGTGEQETLDDIGADYGITRERIRQIQGKAMSKLQLSPETLALRVYLINEPGSGGTAEGKTR
ncbi:hypothetical protein GCM10022225_61180 [Plantactinospora mayteni]|uniref:RNA polymerase sigma-70 domain-containing protein n=1 Tax=Plantactinospora mayteni TaxID=566021 RepID=A0ABQ4EZR1_9ACTN|nr:sigma-70 family RNA polymerase sigma factor [Plantactinospora mayteni]GIH00140.1 hypothetical protein Pma05_67120 [Plantactinospora mayteni]